MFKLKHNIIEDVEKKQQIELVGQFMAKNSLENENESLHMIVTSKTEIFYVCKYISDDTLKLSIGYNAELVPLERDNKKNLLEESTIEYLLKDADDIHIFQIKQEKGSIKTLNLLSIINDDTKIELIDSTKHKTKKQHRILAVLGIEYFQNVIQSATELKELLSLN